MYSNHNSHPDLLDFFNCIVFFETYGKFDMGNIIFSH